VLCELVNDDGTVQRMRKLIEFKQKFGLRMISIPQLIEYRIKVTNWSCSSVPSRFRRNSVNLICMFSAARSTNGSIWADDGSLDFTPTLVRVHSENLLSDVFRAKGSGSGHALAASSRRLPAPDACVVYMEPANPGEVMLQRLNAEPGETISPMGLRDYGTGAQILRMLGLNRIRLPRTAPEDCGSRRLRSGDRRTGAAVAA